MKRLFIFLSLFTIFGLSLQAALPSSFYKSKSVLSEGKWVKVGVDKTGVYEITYDALRQMGFSNPSKVGVYGRGGGMLPFDFVNNAGIATLNDDLTPVKVLHLNNTLYFYGQGPEEISFTTNTQYDTGGYFNRTARNIYSTRGFYFLTDATAPDAMTTKAYENSATAEIEKGVSYIYHELDSIQNSTQSGQLFWGEQIGMPSNRERSWKVEMPDAIEGNGVMQCEIYLSNAENISAFVNFGFKEADYFKTPYKQTGTSYYAPHSPSVGAIGIPGEKGTVFTEFTHDTKLAQSNLDFWVVSYPRRIPTLKDPDGNRVNQQFMVLPDIAKNTAKKFKLEDCSTFVVLDVSTPANPQRLSINMSGSTGWVSVRNSGKAPNIVVFDTDCPQLQISGFENAYNIIDNQNLHGYKETGADFVIISTPALKPYAEEIAELHRKHDGIKVVVATTEECYNEFSGGTPDPMAYRSFVKMLYMSPVKPKNLLLLGQLYGDYRGIKAEKNPEDGIIAFQSPSVSIARGAHNINDFYGVMDDKFRVDYYERNAVQVGVGILPVKFESEARIVVDKIRDYLGRTDHAYYLNRYMAVGGLGDEHTHEIQIGKIDEHLRKYDYHSTIVSPLPMDTYGNTEAHKKFVNSINDGCTLFTYFGHGAEQFLGLDRYFFTAGDVFKLRNKYLPFAGFGGCQITNTDRGMRGLGETIVTATPYGCIGSLVSARETWSGQNLEFFKQFFISMYRQQGLDNGAHNFKPLTIGEIYASVKHISTYSNELAYQLLCDPALVIPIANQYISVDNADAMQALSGETIKITGQVNGEDTKTVDGNYNGEIVVRLMEPAKVFKAGNVATGADVGDLTFTYRDRQITMGVAEVKNGRFSLELHVPASTSQFDGQNALLQLCAFNPSTKAGAGNCVELPCVAKAPGTSSEEKDLVPPTVEIFDFDSTEPAINITVSDNLALNYSSNPFEKGLFLFIDGKEVGEAHFVEPQIEADRPAFSKNIFINGLAYGDHSARIKVKDAAGNVTEQEISFTYSPLQASYSIQLQESDKGRTLILADGIAPANATLHILDIHGNEIWSGVFNGNGTEWNHTDYAGNPVKPGHYKGYIIEKGASNSKGHSATIDIPVI